MTEEFKKRMEEVTAPAIARKQELITASFATAEVYKRIVLGFVGTYDFVSNTFKRDLISDKLRIIIGQPEDIETYKKTYEEGKENTGAIKLKYKSDNMPFCLTNEKANLDMVNKILEQDDIEVEDVSVLDSRYINIYFNASVIIDACTKLDEELSGPQKIKKPNETV